MTEHLRVLSTNLVLVAALGAARIAGPLFVAARIGVDEFGRFALGAAVAGIFVVISDAGQGRLAMRRRAEQPDASLAAAFCRQAAGVAVGGGLALTPIYVGTMVGWFGYGLEVAIAGACMLVGQSLATTLADLRRALGSSTWAIVGAQLPIALMLPGGALVSRPSISALFGVIASAYLVSSIALWGTGFGTSTRRTSSLGSDLRDGTTYAFHGGLSTVSTASPLIIAQQLDSSSLGDVALAIRIYQIQNAAVGGADTTLMPRLAGLPGPPNAEPLSKEVRAVRRLSGAVAATSGAAAIAAAAAFGAFALSGSWGHITPLVLLVAARIVDSASGYNSEALLILNDGRFVNGLYIVLFAALVAVVFAIDPSFGTIAAVSPWVLTLCVWNFACLYRLNRLSLEASARRSL